MMAPHGAELPQIVRILPRHRLDLFRKQLVEGCQLAGGGEARPELVGHVGDVRRDAAGVGGGVTLVPALPRMDDRLQTQVGVQSEEGCQDALEVLGGLSV